MNFTELSTRVRDILKQKHRYAHCVRVARMSERLAHAHGIDTKKARLAGMLHDLARLHSPQQLLRESREFGIAIDDYARAHPVVLHAPVSAQLARRDFGIQDPAILSAIAKHTLADGRMSALDCIVYLADALEPGREFAERAGLAKLAFVDVHAAMHATITSSLRYLSQRHLPLAPQTAEAMRTFGRGADAWEVGTAGHS